MKLRLHFGFYMVGVTVGYLTRPPFLSIHPIFLPRVPKRPLKERIGLRLMITARSRVLAYVERFRERHSYQRNRHRNCQLVPA